MSFLMLAWKWSQKQVPVRLRKSWSLSLCDVCREKVHYSYDLYDPGLVRLYVCPKCTDNYFAGDRIVDDKDICDAITLGNRVGFSCIADITRSLPTTKPANLDEGWRVAFQDPLNYNYRCHSEGCPHPIAYYTDAPGDPSFCFIHSAIFLATTEWGKKRMEHERGESGDPQWFSDHYTPIMERFAEKYVVRWSPPQPPRTFPEKDYAPSGFDPIKYVLSTPSEMRAADPDLDELARLAWDYSGWVPPHIKERIVVLQQGLREKGLIK